MTTHDATEVGISEEVVGYIAERRRRPRPEPEPTWMGYEVGRLSDGAMALVGVISAVVIIAVVWCGFLLVTM